MPATSFASSTLEQGTLPLQVDAVPLGELAQRLSRLSGAAVRVSPGLAAQPVTAHIDGDDIDAALRSFLERYNHLAVVDATGRLRQVWITGTAPTGSARTATAAFPDEAFDETPGKDGDSMFPVALWQIGGEPPTGARPGSHGIETDPSLFADLRVGQPIELSLPPPADAVFGVIGERHEQLGGAVQVWSGPLAGENDLASFTITRGVRTTYVTVATGSEVFEVEIDNETGSGSAIDERDIVTGPQENDMVPVPTR